MIVKIYWYINYLITNYDLYHATPLLKGKKILKSKRIKKKHRKISWARFKIVQGTTNGYVYLTQNMCLAYYYAAIQINYCKVITRMCIFEFEVDENYLEPDYDELKILTGLNN